MTSPGLTPADRKDSEPAKVNGVSGVSAKIDLTDATNIEPVTVARSSHPTHWDGSLEKADHDEISGWVWDPSRPNEAVDVEIMDGDVAILKSVPTNSGLISLQSQETDATASV